MSKTKNIAIDGPAGTGKTTVSTLLAQKLGYQKLDTGAFYRAVTVQALRDPSSMDDEAKCIEFARKVSVTFDKETGVQHMLIDSVECDHELRTPEVSHSVSQVSKYPGVRRIIVDLLQSITDAGGFVAEGLFISY